MFFFQPYDKRINEEGTRGKTKNDKGSPTTTTKRERGYKQKKLTILSHHTKREKRKTDKEPLPFCAMYTKMTKTVR